MYIFVCIKFSHLFTKSLSNDLIHLGNISQWIQNVLWKILEIHDVILTMNIPQSSLTGVQSLSTDFCVFIGTMESFFFFIINNIRKTSLFRNNLRFGVYLIMMNCDFHPWNYII